MADAAPHLCAELVAARAVIAAQTVQIRVLDEQIVVLTHQHEEDEAQKASLCRRVSQLARQVYGTTDESHHADRETVDGLKKPGTRSPAASDGIGPVADSPASAGQQQSSSAKPKNPRKPGKKPGGRTKLPVWMTQREITLDLPESARLGPDGRPMEFIDERRSKRLDFVEPHFEQVIVIQLIYGLPFQNDTRVAAAPLTVNPACCWWRLPAVDLYRPLCGSSVTLDLHHCVLPGRVLHQSLLDQPQVEEFSLSEHLEET